MPILQFPTIRPADVAALKAAGDLPGLVRLLHDRDPNIQWRAADALGSLGSPALPLLIRELDSRHVAARIGAVEALGAIRDPRAVRPLIDAMEHDHNPEVRWVAALALGNIGDPAAVPALLFVLRDRERYIRSSAAMALDRLGWIPENKTETAYRAIAVQDWEKVKRLGTAATSPLTERLFDPDPKTRALVIDLLGVIGDPRAQEACEAGLKDPEEEVRWASVITAKKCRVPVAQIPWGISKRRRTGQNPWAAGILNFLFIGLGYNYLGYWWGFLIFMSYTSILVLAQLEAGPFLPYLIAYPITALFAVQTFYLAKKMQDL
jgi:HEAT repeat protein